MLAAISQGPVKIRAQADNTVFSSYTSGILNSANCGTSPNHAMTDVGYGTDTTVGQEYIIVKNSWGADWGEKGYINIAAVDGKGICGIQ